MLTAVVPRRNQTVTIEVDLSEAYRSGTPSGILAQKWGVGKNQTLSFFVKRNVLLVRINFLARPLKS